MKSVRVYVKDRNTLVLDEDGGKGDYIDLSNVTNLDYKQIEELITLGKDKIYSQKIAEAQRVWHAQSQSEIAQLNSNYQAKLAELNSQLSSIKTNQELLFEQECQKLKTKNSEDLHSWQLRLKELESGYQSEITKLKAELDSLKANQQLVIDQECQKLRDKNNANLLTWQLKEKDYQVQMQNFNITKEKDLESLQSRLVLAHSEELQQLKASLMEQIRLKDEEINLLKRQKGSMNIKQTGEDLEAWCDNEVKSYMQNGLFNCSWEKDNVVVKEADEAHGSKADYIFKIFADADHTQLLASVCLDMKDENPDSIVRKKNSDYYKALDKNRIKKSCKYAVLVSNLEIDKPNDLPIFRVPAYEDMYVVRPAYMMTFLNILTSLSMKFAQLTLTIGLEREENKKASELQNEFYELKRTYLEKPLESLSKKLEVIKKQNETIMEASGRISEACEEIIKSYLNNIINKLDNFEIKIKKAYSR